LLLAQEGSGVLGFLRGLTLRQLRTTRPQMVLYEIGAVPSHRRRGVGRALIGALLAERRAKGYDEAFGLADPANLAAVALYRATGATPEMATDRRFVYRLAPAEPTGAAAPPCSTERVA
jgi:ribosomal protein S18 acetylase RimI-like enzyme